MFDAVLSNRPASPLDFDARLRAVERFLKLDAAASLAAANKRIANILRKADRPTTSGVRPDLLRLDAERQLHGALEELRPEVEPLLARRDYTEALQRLARLREPVDAFFDSVMVMDEDAELRGNRLGLLAALRQLFLHTADLSRLPG
jgi:glycyl-tRNA synthetase beta chain